MVRRAKKLHVKLTVLYSCFAVLLGVFISVFGYRVTWNLATSMYSEKAEQAAALAATYVDGDQIGRYAETLEIDAEYQALQAVLNTMKEKMDILYLYVYQPGSDSFIYLLEAQTPEDDPAYISSLGDVYEYTDLEYTYLVPDVEAKRASDEVIVTTESLFFGSGVSAWAPVLDSQGELAAMVEVDFSLDQVMASIQQSLILMLLVYVAMVVVMVLFQSLSIRRMINTPLKKLTDRTLRFAAKGELSDSGDDIKTGDELQTLSEAFTQMARDIAAYTKEQADMAASRERIATELQVATDMEKSMLPQAIDDFAGKKYIDVQGAIRIAPQMGGDFYDYFVLDDHQMVVVLCDGQDNGIAAAMQLVVTRTIIKSQFAVDRALSNTATEINRQLYVGEGRRRPIGTFLGVLDTEEGLFSYVNAGYNAPIVMRQGERYEILNTPSYVPFGVEENVAYRELRMELRQGDRLLFYSEGVSDAKNEEGECYGAERLRLRLSENRNRDMGSAALLESIFDGIDQFVGSAEAKDDQVLLVLEYRRGSRDQAQIVLAPNMVHLQELLEFIKEQLTVNRISRKKSALVLVCAEEVFSVCCRYAAGDRVEVHCSITEKGKLTLRYTADFQGVNPLTAANSVVKNTIGFLEKNMDCFELLRSGQRSTLILVKDLKEQEASPERDGSPL